MGNLRHETTTFANVKFGTPFKWGQNDCNTIALEFIEIIKPEASILNEVRGKYSTRYEARRFYKEFRMTWVEYLLSIGYKEVDIMFFKPGDLHIHKIGKSLEAVSINLGNNNIIADPNEGICLQNFFGLHDKHAMRAYRLEE